MLTFDELRCAVILMKRAPIKGDESLLVAQTILKLEAMAKALTAKKVEEPAQNDDPRSTE